MEENEKKQRIIKFLTKLSNDTMNGDIHWIQRCKMIPGMSLGKMMNDSDCNMYQEQQKYCTCQLPDGSEVRILSFINSQTFSTKDTKYEVQIEGVSVLTTLGNSGFDVVLKPIVDIAFGLSKHESAENLKNASEIMEKYVCQ